MQLLQLHNNTLEGKIPDFKQVHKLGVMMCNSFTVKICSKPTVEANWVVQVLSNAR